MSQVITQERQKIFLSQRVMAKPAINSVMKLDKGGAIAYISCLVYVVLANNAMHG
jgi:hypothetical protein